MSNNVTSSCRAPNDKIGDIRLIGIYNGAICWREQLVRFENDDAIWHRVVARQVKNSDGTFSHVWELSK